MEEITSVNNDLVKITTKLALKKYRDESKLFLLEGFKAINEAFLSKVEIKHVFINSSAIKKYSFLTCPKISTTEAVLKKISTTDSAPEAVAVAKQIDFSIDDLNNTQKVILLENIKDYGNLGTILRTASAFSADAVILYGDTVDLYNPKCVRSAVGNLWKLPVVQIKDLNVLKNKFESYEKIATLPKSGDSIYLKDYIATSKFLLMFGSEADGLSEELIKFADKKVTIEMNKSVESLNLGVSVAVCLYAITKLKG